MIAENLKRHTERKEISIMDLSRVTKIPKTTIYSITDGKSKCQTVYTIKKIADALGITIDELITNPETEEGANAKIMSLAKRAKKLNTTEQENISLILETAIMAAERKQRK